MDLGILPKYIMIVLILWNAGTYIGGFQLEFVSIISRVINHMTCYNVCFKKTGTKHSIVLLLRFVPVFLKQTLPKALARAQIWYLGCQHQ